ncbi:MAG: hypothetical protein ACJ74W_10105 [Pyrinomonadaceae bacterium]
MAESVKVPVNYHCPFCPDHHDNSFVFSKIVGAPICEGCAIEISHFVEADERPDDFVLDQLEALTGLSFPQYKRIAFEEFVEEFERRLQPENVEREAQTEMYITKRSLAEVVKSWHDLIDYYKAEINRLSSEDGNDNGQQAIS